MNPKAIDTLNILKAKIRKILPKIQNKSKDVQRRIEYHNLISARSTFKWKIVFQKLGLCYVTFDF